ncbi:hypothetical protein ABT143_18260 [Streptomyces sp. NPDC002033]|uniref:hypothetical protein n=1 Tax=Streptomyces sp. NPDC002033 TaxID=3154533 RepID=UPI003316A6F6
MPLVDEGLRGHPVHADAHAGRDRAVDRRGDEGVEELHDRLALQARQDGEDTGGPQLVDGVGGLGLAEGGDVPDDADRDGVAEYGRGPGQPDGGGAELFEPLDQAAALDGRGQVAELGDVVLVRLEAAVAALHAEFDDLEGVASGDRPALAAEHVVGALAQGLAHDAGHRARGERGQLVRARPLAAHQGAQRGGVRRDLVRAAGHHDQHGQFLGPRREGGQPGQGFGVGPVRVVEDEDHGGSAAYR